MSGLCELCPRRCAADRFRPGGRPGFCGAGDCPRVFRWGPHFGEEPPITGERGSGCVFFSRCTMKCLYCQNSPWSWRGEGEDVSVARLADIMRSLAVEDRVENWNLVSPTPYLPFIREAARILAHEGVRLPFVWNSSGYERVETLEEYADLCDCALFDLRYSRDETALAASAAPGYVAAARAAVKWAWERGVRGTGNGERGTGNRLRGDGRETLDDRREDSSRLASDASRPSPNTQKPNTHPPKKPNTQTPPNPYTQTLPNPNTQTLPPLVVRILVLPGHADEAIENLAWLATEVSNEVPVSVMAQYTPAYRALETPPWNRPVTKEEYEEVAEAASDFGFENGWTQGYEASDPKLALLGENMPPAHGTVK